MPAPRWVARFNRRVTNRLLGGLATRLPGMGIVVHTGRKSRREYRTPVFVFPHDNGYVIALTYGADADWVRNVLAAGGAKLVTRGHTFRLARPRLTHDESRRAVPPLIRLGLRLGHISDFLVLSREKEDDSAPRSQPIVQSEAASGLAAGPLSHSSQGDASALPDRSPTSTGHRGVPERLRWATIGSALFFLVGPGVVVGVAPWLVTRWRMQRLAPRWQPLRGLGVILISAGLAALAHAFMRFVVEGVGTPVPVAPPQHLVVGGAYRYVRNPMYLALVASILGQALLLGQPVLLLYAAALWLYAAAFVRWVEEPRLQRRFGAAYDAYRRAVPAWWPRLRPVKAGEPFALAGE